MIPERSIVRNADIDHQLSAYLEIYGDCNCIAFELEISQYEALTKITKSYKTARTREDFDKAEWTQRVTSEGLLDDERATFVFGFLALHWNQKTQVSVVDGRPGFVLLRVVNRGLDSG